MKLRENQTFPMFVTYPRNISHAYSPGQLYNYLTYVILYSCWKTINTQFDISIQPFPLESNSSWYLCNARLEFIPGWNYNVFFTLFESDCWPLVLLLLLLRQLFIGCARRFLVAFNLLSEFVMLPFRRTSWTKS
jgi:hypothetical protein